MSAELKTLRVLYFASLRETLGRSEETVTTRAGSARELLEELARARGKLLGNAVVKVAVNDRIVPWESAIQDGDSVVFLTPFGGG